MALASRILVLVAFARSCLGARIEGKANVATAEDFFSTVHCVVENGTESLCWEGPAGEGRLHAICGGHGSRGECKKQGYDCDVSGASLQRFTWFLGLSLFKAPSAIGTCSPEDRRRDLQAAAMFSAVQQNGICPALLGGVGSLKEDATMHLSNISTHISRCSGKVQSKACSETVASLLVPRLVEQIFVHLEKKLGLDWARRVTGSHPVAEAIANEEKLPQEARQFARALHSAMENPVAIARDLLSRWDAVKELMRKVLPEYLLLVVQPATELLLDKLPSDFTDKVEERIDSEKVDELERGAQSLMGKVVATVEGLCLLPETVGDKIHNSKLQDKEA